MTIETAYSLAFNITGLPDPIIYKPDDVISIKSRIDFKAVRYLRKFRNVKKRSVTDMDLPTRLVAACEVGVGDWVLLPRRTDLPPTELTPDKLYAAGFWLAEGHHLKESKKGTKLFGQPVGVCLTNTDRTYLERVQPILHDWFPVSASHIRAEYLKNPKHKTKYILEFRSHDVAKFFHPTFGEYSYGKFIGSSIYERSGLLPLVCGFIDGDGCQFSKGERIGEVAMITTSRQLVYQLRQILLDEGIWTILQHRKSDKPKHHPKYALTISSSHTYLLKWATKVDFLGVRNRQNYAILTPEGFYVRVKNITLIESNT